MSVSAGRGAPMSERGRQSSGRDTVGGPVVRMRCPASRRARRSPRTGADADGRDD